MAEARLIIWSWVQQTIRKFVNPVGMLAFALALLIGVIVFAIFYLPPPDSDDSKFQLVAILASIVAVIGVILSLGAGIWEVRHIFPKQELTFRISRYEVEGLTCYRLEIVNGASIVSSARVEVQVESLGASEAQDPELIWEHMWKREHKIDVEHQHLRPHESWDVLPESFNRQAIAEQPWVFDVSGSVSIFPNQTLMGPTVTGDFRWVVRWWTDRSGLNWGYIYNDEVVGRRAHFRIRGLGRTAKRIPYPGDW